MAAAEAEEAKEAKEAARARGVARTRVAAVAAEAGAEPAPEVSVFAPNAELPHPIGKGFPAST